MAIGKISGKSANFNKFLSTNSKKNILEIKADGFHIGSNVNNKSIT